MRLFFTKTITVYRLTNDTGTTIKEGYTLNGTIEGAIMNAQPTDAMLSEGNPSKSSVLFCDSEADIVDSDKITADGVNFYVAKGVGQTNGIGLSLSYKKVMIEKLKS